jgi:hypothetical protein
VTVTDSASIELAFDLAFTGMCGADTFEIAEAHFGHALCDLYRLFELVKPTANSGKSEKKAAIAAREAKLKVTSEGQTALAAAWARTFRVHDVIEVTEPADLYSDYYTNLYGVLAWRPRTFAPEATYPENRGGFYDCRLAGRPVLDTMQSAFQALLAIT